MLTFLAHVHNADFCGFLRVVYCASVKVSQDSALHMTGKSEDYVDAIYKQVRFVTAWNEMQHSHSLEFSSGVVEVDSCRTASQKKKVDKRFLSAKAKAAFKRPSSSLQTRGRSVAKKPAGKVRTHAGRLLVAVSRKDKQTAWFPLPDKHTMQNAPGPPETTEEILPIMSRKLDSQKHMVASDSSKGIGAACKALNLPSATARHSLSEFTPVQRVKTKSIAKKCLNALTRRRQKTSARVGSRETILVGGDQVAESHTAVLKKQLRRNNKLAGLTPRGAHIAGLSAVHIHRNLGFENVVQFS